MLLPACIAGSTLTHPPRCLQTVCGDQYPRIAIQLPMFNERAVCQAAIDSACEQSWPKSKLIVQVRHCTRDTTRLHIQFTTLDH